MFKKTLLIALLALGMTAPTMAEVSPTASTEIYDFTGLGDDILDVFYTALQNGHKYPTDAEFQAAGISLFDLHYVRSHVRPHSLINLSGDTYTNYAGTTFAKSRKLWMNIPLGIGKTQGGYPSSNFCDDTFTGWNYTAIFGSWNNGLFHAPGVGVDCAHKNGADMYTGIKFFESWTSGSGASGWVAKVQATDSSTYGYDGYKYVKPLIHALMYFGHDGINYNFEDTGYSNCASFHAACYKYAAECGFDNFHVGLYTAQSTLTTSNVKGLFTDTNGNKAYDTFLNYSASDFQTAANIRSSVTAAEASALGTCDGVFQGTWIVSMARSWSNLSSNATNKKMGIVLWGEHAQSRLFSYTAGTSSMNLQENYQKMQDRFFCGGNRNVASLPTETTSAEWGTMEKFQGLAYYVSERAAISQNLPFTTFFCTGSGDRYNYKGKKTLGSWYNLGQQDLAITYRWLVYNAGTTTAVVDNTTTSAEANGGTTSNNGVPELTSSDAYVGGSCLRLTNTSAVDIVLYRMSLKARSSSVKAKIALKRPSSVAASDVTGTVKIIYKLKGSSTWKEIPFNGVTSTSWEEQEVSVSGLSSGSEIEYLGLRTTGKTKGLLVGELSLSDGTTVTPSGIKNVQYQVKEESQTSLSIKLCWDLEGTPDAYGRLYNDEGNIDHFEVFYKDGDKGDGYEVARTTGWAAYVGNIPMTTTTKPYIGVRAVSIDGVTTSPIVWNEVTRAATSTLPETSSTSGTYPSIILDNSSDGLTNALTMRYIAQLAVSNSDGDFTYTNSVGTPYQVDIANGISADNADKTNYIFAEDNVIKCHQGQTFTVKSYIATVGTDDLHYCTGFVYVDWDCNGAFNATTDENVFLANGNATFWGASNQKSAVTELSNQPSTFTVTVPNDAVPGTSRLRMVFSDAWFPHPGASGTTNKGFAIDFPMEITGTNTPREAEVDTRDEGVAEPAIPAGSAEEILGDVTNNGYVTIADVATYIKGIRANNASTLPNADVTGNAKYNQSDVQAIVNKILAGEATGKPASVAQHCDNCGNEMVDGVCVNTYCTDSPNYVERCDNCHEPLTDGVCQNQDCTECPNYVAHCDNCNTALVAGECPNTSCPNCPNYVVTTCPAENVAYALQAEGYSVYLDVETGVADGNAAYTNSVGFSSTPKAVYFEQSGTSWKIKNANGKYVSMPNSWNVVITDSSDATWTVSEVESGYVTITKSSNSSNYWSGDAANSTSIANGKPVYCDKTTALRFKWTLFKE